MIVHYEGDLITAAGDIRSAAVEWVDSVDGCGAHTWEFCGVAHRDWYDEREAELWEKLPLIEAFPEPQPSPQQWDCGCTAVIRVTDADFRFRGKPFELRLARECEALECETMAARIKEDDRFVSRSGRRWKVMVSRFARPKHTIVMPLGDDTFGFGGVKARQVENRRLVGETHGWRRV